MVTKLKSMYKAMVFICLKAGVFGCAADGPAVFGQVIKETCITQIIIVLLHKNAHAFISPKLLIRVLGTGVF